MPAISEAEKLRRRESVNSAIGTTAIAGQFLDAKTIALFDLYVDGELSQQELSAAINSHVADLVRASGYEMPAHLVSN